MIPQEHVEAFRKSLFTGGYNLLLGSGTSLDSNNGMGELLRSTEKLRQDLCKLKTVRESTGLTRVAGMLDAREIEIQLVKGYSNCKPGKSLHQFPNYLWKRIFTFNIDDVLENLYKGNSIAKQTLVPINYDSQFEPAPTRDELQAIHLHGWVGEPKTPFVFSYTEYVKYMRAMSPWMHMLAEILPAESFIIAGTSLNEVDLEYYLSSRNTATPRRGKGPSILIEPYPDAATEADCAKYGLMLVKATFGDFLHWLQKEFPSPPTLANLIVPNSGNLFQKKVTPYQLLKFFSDFKLNEFGSKPRPSLPSPFLYGREPKQEDIDANLDVPRKDNDNVIKDVEEMLGNIHDPKTSKIAILLDEAGSGKSTILQRVASELMQMGRPVLSIHNISKIDVRNSVDCISALTSPVILLVDHFADHIEQVVEIVNDPQTAGKAVVLGCERSYRKEYLDLIIGDNECIRRNLYDFTILELEQLIELYRGFGLIAVREALFDPTGFAYKLKGDKVAIAVCRILKDFQPIAKIVESLWEEAPKEHRFPYLCVALAAHCHSTGIRYSVLQKIAGNKLSINDMLTNEVPLGLTECLESDEYLVPLNGIYADLLLHKAKHNPALLEAFKEIAKGLAPYVNRNAVRLKTPEARLAGRLLDADKIVKPLLGEKSDELYESCQKDWAWNSRYWEQRALLIAADDIHSALQYARHAVAIENHPFTLTTLSKILLMQMEKLNQTTDSYIFTEAFDRLNEAIAMEGLKSRVSIQPFMTLLHGSVRFIELGGAFTTNQKEVLTKQMGSAEYYFSRDKQMSLWLERLDKYL